MVEKRTVLEQVATELNKTLDFSKMFETVLYEKLRQAFRADIFFLQFYNNDGVYICSNNHKKVWLYVVDLSGLGFHANPLRFEFMETSGGLTDEQKETLRFVLAGLCFEEITR
jgi:hypothetical protein